MANMSYCRFRNTEIDLVDCLIAINDKEEMSKDEYNACVRMFDTFFEFLYQQGILDDSTEDPDEVYDRLEDFYRELRERNGL